jgi:NAD(P)-dependent dehydrogenase (short-subunit alcohol dehydrogenase family)
MMPGMSVYGTTKYAIRYLSRTLANEYRGKNIIIGAISPGMVVTDMLLGSLRDHPEKQKDALKIFQILADPPERVAPWIVERILKNRKNGRRIAWLSPPKIMYRFFISMFKKRRVKGLPDF